MCHVNTSSGLGEMKDKLLLHLAGLLNTLLPKAEAAFLGLELWPEGAICMWEPSSCQNYSGPSNVFGLIAASYLTWAPVPYSHAASQVGDKAFVQDEQRFPCVVLPSQCL
ncbi:hypothetical protein H8959_003668 [Pygathrix nigripes]